MQLDAATSRLVSTALLRLRVRSPFFATLALFARVEATHMLPTAATDGRDIFLNPAFFGGLSAAEQDGLLLHEVLHAALLHVPRRGGREPLLWNVAADIVVNAIVLAEPGCALPAGALRDPALERLSVEEVYDLLLREAVAPYLDWADLLNQAPEDARPGIPLPRAALEANWRNALRQARIVAESITQGTLPAGLARELGVLGPAQLDWRAYLWRFVVQTPVDFGDFDRRFVGRRLYVETLSGEAVRVRVAVDTSGSVSDRQMGVLLSEVCGIVQAYPHLQGELCYADSALHGPYPLAAGASLPRPIGGGGTDFRPFFDRVAGEHEPWTSGVCIYLTDGYGTFPPAPPADPVLWVVTPGGCDLAAFPFGEVVRLLEGR